MLGSGVGYKRSDRVGDLVKKEIASMLLHGDIKDPRIGFITITRVKMSVDLRRARVFFSMIGTDEEKRRSCEGLNSASGFIRRALARRLKLKHIPSIIFEFDDSIEYSSYIDKLMRDLKREGRS